MVGRKLLTREENWTLPFLVSKRLPTASHGLGTTWCNLMSCHVSMPYMAKNIHFTDLRRKTKRNLNPEIVNHNNQKETSRSPKKIVFAPLFSMQLFFIPAIPEDNSLLYLPITHLPSVSSLGTGDWEQRRYSFSSFSQ